MKYKKINYQIKQKNINNKRNKIKLLMYTSKNKKKKSLKL